MLCSWDMVSVIDGLSESLIVNDLSRVAVSGVSEVEGVLEMDSDESLESVTEPEPERLADFVSEVSSESVIDTDAERLKEGESVTDDDKVLLVLSSSLKD